MVKVRVPMFVLDRSNGLRNAQVLRMVLDARGRLCFTGPLGLGRYDGARVTTFGKAEGLSTLGPRAIARDADGRVWIGSSTGIDWLIDDSTFERKTGTTWHYGFVDRIVFDSHQTVWLATASGLVRGRAEEGFALHAAPGIADALPRQLVLAHDGTVLAIAATGEIMRAEQGQVVVLQVLDALEAEFVRTIASGWDDNILVATEHEVLQVSTQGAKRAVVCAISNSDSGAVAAMTYADGELWIATRAGLQCYRHVAHQWRLEFSVEIRADVTDLLVDGFGNLWIATDSIGVLRLSLWHRSILFPRFADAASVSAIHFAASSRALIGGDRRTLDVDINSLAFDANKHQLAGFCVWDLTKDEQGVLWAATQQGLFRIAAGAEPEQIGAHDAVLAAPNRVLLRQPGCLWVGTMQGLVRVQVGVVPLDMASPGVSAPEVSQVRDAAGQSLGYVYTLAALGDDTVLVGTLGNGVWEVTSGGMPERLNIPGLESSGQTYAIATRADGTVAILHENRIYLREPHDSWRLFTQVAEDIVGWAAVLHGDSLWVGGNDGVAEYSLRDGRCRRIINGWINETGWEFTTSRSLAIDARNRLWCGLSTGLAIVDIDAVEEVRTLPTVARGSVRWRNAKVESHGRTELVQVGKWTVQVELFTAWYVDEADLSIDYRLLGFESGWRRTTRAAALQFSSLPEGDYTLEARTYSKATGLGAPSTILSISVVESAAGEGASFTPGSTTTRMMTLHASPELLAEKLALEQQVQLRTVELRDVNLALQRSNELLTRQSLTDPLTGIGNRRQFDEVIQREYLRAWRRGRSLSLILIDVDFFKAYNDTYGHPAGDDCLQQLASLFAHGVRAGGDFVARYGGEEFAVILPELGSEVAVTVAEDLRLTVAKLQLGHPAGSVTVSRSVTVSCGVATLTPQADDYTKAAKGSEIFALTAAADAALYQAKRAGRNRTESTVL